MVCATPTHQIATPNTRSTADRGPTFVVVVGQRDSTGQTNSSKLTSMVVTGQEILKCIMYPVS